MIENNSATQALAKCPTGIKGLDEITGGGLPRGRPTLVCGGAGDGKTLLATEFLVHGAREFGEPGVFVTFEETEAELVANAASLGFDLTGLKDREMLHIEEMRFDPLEIVEAGDFDLSGIFTRLELVVGKLQARRVVLDTTEILLSGLENTARVRSELGRLFRFLKDKGLTVLITGERGREGDLTRYGIEEYVSDCVVLLDQRIQEKMAVRRLRVLKYRGTNHGMNEYPFIISEHGISVLPITSVLLEAEASEERVSSGIEQLDEMLGGQGFYRGSSVLVSGTPGTGKSSLAAHFALASCRRNESCLYFAFEESKSQIVRNMRSIGIDLEPHLDSGLLHFYNVRPTLFGLETHLITILEVAKARRPTNVVIDPISNFLDVGSASEVKSMLMRVFDHFKSNQTTCLCTSLTSGDRNHESTEAGISSLMDTWIILRNLESNGGALTRALYVLKSRGMRNDNRVRAFVINDDGFSIT